MPGRVRCAKLLSACAASPCSILVANNGIGAVKFMRSVRSWAYKAFGSERALTLVAMATPEDMRMVRRVMFPFLCCLTD